MTMSDMRYLIVLRCNIVKFFISKTQYLTFLLLRSPSLVSNLQQKEVTIDAELALIVT